jgi:hypothetical protein
MTTTVPSRRANDPAGLRSHPAEYARRTTAFLDHALSPKETP